eukprot:7727086-Pyramimonas_sp.AAC.1
MWAGTGIVREQELRQDVVDCEQCHLPRGLDPSSVVSSETMVMTVEVDMEVLQAGVADAQFGDSARDDRGEVDHRHGVVLVAVGEELWDEEGDAARRIG